MESFCVYKLSTSCRKNHVFYFLFRIWVFPKSPVCKHQGWPLSLEGKPFTLLPMATSSHVLWPNSWSGRVPCELAWLQTLYLLYCHYKVNHVNTQQVSTCKYIQKSVKKKKQYLHMFHRVTLVEEWCSLTQPTTLPGSMVSFLPLVNLSVLHLLDSWTSVHTCSGSPLLLTGPRDV